MEVANFIEVFQQLSYTIDRSHILGEMISHTGNRHIPVIMVCDTDAPHTPRKTVSHTGGSPFLPRDPHIPKKMGTPGHYSLGNVGTWVPIFPGM